MSKHLVLILLLLLKSIHGSTCSCHDDIGEISTYKYNEYELIFIGKVDSVGICDQTKAVKFTVDKSYKGNKEGAVIFYNIDCKSSCGFNFAKGETYLVYASNDKTGQYTIEICSGTRKVFSQEDIIQMRAKLKADNLPFEHFLEKEITTWNNEISFLEKISSHHNGHLKFEYPNKQLISKGKYVHGKPEGEWVYFYPDGNVKAIGSYLNGKRDGFWIEYTTYYNTYEDTATYRKKFLIKSYGHYEGGLKEGKWERINPNGLVRRMYYRKGEFVGE